MSSLDELPGRPLPMRSTERCGLCAAICAALVARTSALFNKSAREGACMLGWADQPRPRKM